MEIMTESVTVHGKRCSGCERYNKSVMMAVKEEGAKEGHFIDIFLTQEQAERLFEKLGRVVNDNKE